MKEPSGNGYVPIIAQAIEEMKAEWGDTFSLEQINLAELERRTGISRGKLRRLKKNGFQDSRRNGDSGKHKITKLTGYSGIIDTLLKQGVSNSTVILNRLQESGFEGKLTIVKDYIAAHKYLLPAKRQQVAPQGNRGRRYSSDPGETYQMDWGFTDVLDHDGNIYRVACFAMICHHCGERYIEFFPNAKQENLFIGMIHAFQYMGIPRYVLTDNMKSVVLHRDLDGRPVWQKDYEAFMRTVGFDTKLCKPRHPFTKGAVERLIRFVKENFLSDRVFCDVTDLNWQALEWCNAQNGIYHRAVDGVPQQIHDAACSSHLRRLPDSDEVRGYLCPNRRISFDGFVNYEGRRFGVPYSYAGSTARVMRSGDTLYIYSTDMNSLLATHAVTWSHRDSFCEGQYEVQPEEFPTAPVKTQLRQLPKPASNLSFAKFDFDDEEDAPTEAHSNKNRSYVSLDLDNAKEIIGEKVIETIDKTKEKIENFNVSEKLDKAKEIIEEMTQPAAEPESSKEEPAPEKNEEEKNADNSSSISIAYADDDDEASSEEFFDDEDEESEDKPEA